MILETSDRERGVAHEAGHAIAGLHLGIITIESIRVRNGRPNNVTEASTPERTPRERCIFLAAGVASEIFCFPDTEYDPEAYLADQAIIEEVDGGSLVTFLPAATEILRSQWTALLLLRRRLEIAWSEAEFRIADGPRVTEDFLLLLTRKEVQAAWNATANRSSSVDLREGNGSK